jgi:hypothetical protein
MTEKSTKGRRVPTTDELPKSETRRSGTLPFSRFRMSYTFRWSSLALAGWFLLSGFGLGDLQAKPKTDKFRGTVVVVGPKAITVKDRDNIYLVRSFRYSPELEQKLLRNKPEAGKKVTVHYVRGSDVALKID